MKIYIIQFINYTLSFMMWMIIGRVFLSLIVGGNPNNLFMRLFTKFTEPIHNITRKVLPFAKGGWVPFFSVVLIIVLRLALVIIFEPGTRR